MVKFFNEENARDDRASARWHHDGRVVGLPIPVVYRRVPDPYMVMMDIQWSLAIALQDCLLQIAVRSQRRPAGYIHG